MSPSRCSGNFSSRSLGGSLRCQDSSCGSSHPSNLVPSRGLCSSSPCPQGPSLHSGYQVTCRAPSSCRPSCCSPRVSLLGSPCQAPVPGALGWGSSSSCSLGCGAGGLRPLGHRVCGVPVLSPGSGSCRPTCGPSRTCQASCYRPACGSNCY
ncbi:keratin-associated protein 13-1-like [Artibeus jamaicensis]|uniref:keratin-associated protein 13-1-like n=1 Tax=Artibeus jamaicensis TaxID=9417 RepID=UPI00235A58FC|nr:keratin-associated protein 13-1-like [Artibeus jamaicensis]